MINTAVIILFLSKLIKSEEFNNSDTVPRQERFAFKSNIYRVKFNAKVTEAVHHILHPYGLKNPQRPKMRDFKKYCQSFDSCHKCAQSLWYPCNWCHDFGCTDRSDKCPHYPKKFYQTRNMTCPYIYSKTPILIHSGIIKQIEVNINVPDPALLKKDLICQIKLKNNRIMHLKGILLRNVVYCYPVEITSNGAEVGAFNLLWGGTEPYSNIIPLLVYHCNKMADECQSCLKLPEVYGCGWCKETKRCAFINQCNDLSTWSLDNMTCEAKDQQMFFV